MNPSPPSFRIRILIIALVAIAWLAITRESPADVDVHGNVAPPAASEVVVAGKPGVDRDHR